MRLTITITFDEEVTLGPDQTWIAMVEQVREQVREDPAGYLTRANRGLVHVSVKVW